MKLLFQAMIFITVIISLNISYNIIGHSEEYIAQHYYYERGQERSKQKSRKQKSQKRRRRIPRSRSRDYVRKNPTTVAILSAIAPGMGQVYADKPGKGIAFFMSDIALLGAALYHLDRANRSDDYANRYDSYLDGHDTYRQSYVKSNGHNALGTALLLGWLGVHVWNIFDAAETARSYNIRRARAIGMKSPLNNEIHISLNARF